MAREFELDLTLGLPSAVTVLAGPRFAGKARLMVDTGTEHTQIDRGVAQRLGFSFADRAPDLLMRGVTGEEPGFSITLKRVFLLGKMLKNVPIGVFDFGDWTKQGIQGLVGFNLLRKFHLEMDGPRGTIKIL